MILLRLIENTYYCTLKLVSNADFHTLKISKKITIIIK